MKNPGKWIEGLLPDTPLHEAAARTITERTEAVCAHLAGAPEEGEAGETAVHKLRVSCRRLESSLRALRIWLDDKQYKRARRTLRDIRRAAGDTRDCDVAIQRLRERFADAPEGGDEAMEFLEASLASQREDARRRLERATRKHTEPSLRRLADRLAKSAQALDATRGDLTFRDAAWAVIPSTVHRARDAWQEDLTSVEALHTLRIELKRLRYTLEVFEPCLDEAFHTQVYPTMRDAQDWLGALNDAETAALRIEAALASADPDGQTREALMRMLDALRADAETAARGFTSEWPSRRAEGFLRDVVALLRPPAAPIEPAAPPKRFTPETGSAPSNGHAHADHGRRVAVIDIGTNSIRLIVAEAMPDASYRVIDDEKETTRLGAGLGQSGVMTTPSMQRAAGVVGHMARIARGYAADRIRAIGTAAVRDALNRDEFIEMVRAAAGVEIEPISPSEEARLAYTSAAGAFDLRECNAAVMDVGGGSTEIVLCAKGVIDRIHAVPLGAVRLTERFGGPEESCGPRYEQMRRFAADAVAEIVGVPPFTPDTLVCSGGTCTNLALMTMAIDTGSLPKEVAPAALRSQVVRRAHVEHLLDRLRRMSVAERVRTAGLSPDRADIIVAGLTLVDAAMETLGVKALRVHERGIRDGLLRIMIAELGEGARAASAPDPRQSVVRFADTCRFERAHCDHVARLAVQLFDQFAQQFEADGDGNAPWRSPGARLLLESAALLHDVGYHINYDKHHKHSYHLIIHSDLPGFTPRDVAVIANVARYHRGARPKESHQGFAALAPDDRELVRRLSAILRVADGLDRPHTGNVQRVGVRIDAGTAHFDIEAPREPSVEIWGAQRKADLFRAVFRLEPTFQRVNARPAPAPSTERVS